MSAYFVILPLSEWVARLAKQPSPKDFIFISFLSEGKDTTTAFANYCGSCRPDYTHWQLPGLLLQSDASNRAHSSKVSYKFSISFVQVKFIALKSIYLTSDKII